MGKQIVTDSAPQMYIELSLLKPSPLNTFETGDIGDLKGNILSCGLLTPPTVIGPAEDGSYEILAGERRYHALKEINAENPELFNSIPCYVCGPEAMDVLEKQLIIESSNLETRDFDKNEHRFRVLGILKEMQDKGDLQHLDVVRAARNYMNCSERYSRMYMQVFNNNNEELSQLISDKKVTVQLASRIAGLDEDKQKEAIERIQQGEKAKDVLDEFVQKSPDTDGKEQASEKESSDSSSSVPQDESKGTEKEDSSTPYGQYGKEYADDQFMQLTGSSDISEIDQAFFGGKSNIDPQMDSVGGLNLRAGDSDTGDSDEKLAKDVIRWCNRMLKKTDFTDLEEQVFEKMKEVLEYVSA